MEHLHGQNGGAQGLDHQRNSHETIQDTHGFHPQLFQGKRVLVTGATSGIGRAIADAFWRCGAFVCALGRNQGVLDQLAATYKDRGSVWACDLGVHADIAPTMQAIEQEGPLDIVVNNAGVTRDGLAIRMTQEQWTEVLNLNLTSCFLVAKEACKSMMKRRQGRIINISSVVAVTGNAGQANYCAAKAGLIAMTKSLALEMAARNILVNAIAPGFIQTPMTEGLQADALKERIPLARYGLCDEIAAGALFLAMPQASYITGHTLHINGGMAMV
jgi:3-oxoacyl-[acyl-carrier protein] reductase